MKIRNGFVSNSSSSSFVIAIAKVKPEKEKDIFEVAEFEGISKFDYEFEIFDPVKNEKIEVESFTNDFVSKDMDELQAGDVVLKIYWIGDEGDSHFMNDDWGEMNYNIDYEDLDVSITNFLKKIEPYVEGLDYSYGAERNG